jgi:hypothetical protein
VLAVLLAALVVPGFWVVGLIIALIILLRKIILAHRGDAGSGNPLDVNSSLG